MVVACRDFTENGKKLSYFAYISLLKNPDCNAALKRIYERIDMDKINRVVEETPFLEPVQQEFYQIMLKERKEKILDFSRELLLRQELREEPKQTAPMQSM